MNSPKALLCDQSKCRVIDLRSDTLTLPTPEMQKAMAYAPLGDDLHGEDPTVNKLENYCAKLFGKESAIFLTSGTMANLIAVMIHCNRHGSEAIVGDCSHIFIMEQGNAAQIGRVQLSLIKTQPDGTFCLNEFRNKIRKYSVLYPITCMAAIENSFANIGGKILPLDFIERLSLICKENKIKLHMDGARIFHAAAATNLSVSRISRDVDTVCFCLSKGLGSPVGSILMGPKEFIDKAKHLRDIIGAGVDKVGIFATAGLWSLDNIAPILHHDIRRAKLIGYAIQRLNSPIASVDEIQSNIINIELNKINANDMKERLIKITNTEISNNITDDNGNGISLKLFVRNVNSVRIIIFHEITEKDVELTIKKLIYCIKEIEEEMITSVVE